MTGDAQRMDAGRDAAGSGAARPRVICHMMTSVDGRIVVDGWPLSPEGRRQYELVHGTYEPDGWICGRVTMEQHFAAGTRSDAAVAVEKLGARLGVRTLVLEGGGGVNGSFFRAGLIDEVSLLVAPVADGRAGTPALFDVAGESVAPRRLALAGVERRADDVLWLRYRVEPSAGAT